jgi:integrase
MPIDKVADKDVKGLFRRKGTRGDTWIYARFKDGKMERGSLGPCEIHTVEEARRWATLRNTVAAGKVPEYTLEEVLKQQGQKAKLKGYRKPEYVRNSIETHSPDWLKLPLAKITKAMVNDRHDKIAYTKIPVKGGRAKCGPMAARHFVKNLCTLFNFAERTMDYEGRNPARGVEYAPQVCRQVVWTQDELERFLAVCKADSEYWFNFFTVLIETGMRRGNVQSMEWSEVNGAVWVIPASKFKTKIPHVAHLTPEAVKAIEGQRGLDKRYVFPSLCKPNAPLRDPNDKFGRLCKKAGITGRTIHDIRRTLGSRLAAKVPMQVVAKILGHKTISTTINHYAVIDDDTAKAALMSLYGKTAGAAPHGAGQDLT